MGEAFALCLNLHFQQCFFKIKLEFACTGMKHAWDQPKWLQEI
jgi:hypothetical protein